MRNIGVYFLLYKLYLYETVIDIYSRHVLCLSRNRSICLESLLWKHIYTDKASGNQRLSDNNLGSLGAEPGKMMDELWRVIFVSIVLAVAADSTIALSFLLCIASHNKGRRRWTNIGVGGCHRHRWGASFKIQQVAKLWKTIKRLLFDWSTQEHPKVKAKNR